ncbi:hypothetical protein [Acidisoma sp. S159]|uniref:hypothetical protein n=1 Tax=Acidisoma sp. S159 TaxID=1747225 RepID=UPI00131AA688|nr:hypothetical protein [Acidisoma sp. S159]
MHFPSLQRAGSGRLASFVHHVTTWITPALAVLPQLGAVDLQGDDLPRGDLQSARIRRDDTHWIIDARFETLVRKPFVRKPKVTEIEVEERPEPEVITPSAKALFASLSRRFQVQEHRYAELLNLRIPPDSGASCFDADARLIASELETAPRRQAA